MAAKGYLSHVPHTVYAGNSIGGISARLGGFLVLMPETAKKLTAGAGG
jgi:hypothetical protein